MAWVPSRSCRSEPTPPQPISTNLATRPRYVDGLTVNQKRIYGIMKATERGRLAAVVGHQVDALALDPVWELPVHRPI
jgi:hypothetical protein